MFMDSKNNPDTKKCSRDSENYSLFKNYVHGFKKCFIRLNQMFPSFKFFVHGLKNRFTELKKAVTDTK